MSVAVMSWVFANAPRDAEAGDMLVLLVLAEHANAEGGLSYPSVKRIAEMSRMSERGVQYVLRRLVDRGLIAIQFEATNRRPTVYCFPAFRGEAPSPQAESRGATDDTLGVQPTTSRGAASCTLTVIEPSREPSTPLPPKRGEYTAEFEIFWAKYPKVLNNSKQKAARVFGNLSAAKRKAALAGLDKYLASPGWRDGFAPHASTYLNGALWESDPPPAKANGHAAPVVRPEERRPAIPTFEQALEPPKRMSEEKLAEIRAWKEQRQT